MTPDILHSIWAIARRRHHVVTEAELLGLGLTREAIRHRRRTGLLHRLWPRVYAVGRPDVTPQGRWAAAVLTCGEGAYLSHESAAQCLGILPIRNGPVHVSVPYPRAVRRRGIVTHRRRLGPDAITMRDGIPVTTPVVTLLDLAARHGDEVIERAVGAADMNGLVDPDTLRAALEPLAPRRGAGRLRRVLDRHTFVLTHDELERRFVAIVRKAGLPLPKGQDRLGPHRVDFHWPDLGLVVETDGLTYHRTPAQQAADLARDHAHAVAGRLTLRFSHAQVRFQADHVERTLVAVARRAAAVRPAARGGLAA